MKIVVEIENVPFEASLMGKPLWVQLCDQNGHALSRMVSIPIVTGTHERKIGGNYPREIYLDVWMATVADGLTNTRTPGMSLKLDREGQLPSDTLTQNFLF